MDTDTRTEAHKFPVCPACKYEISDPWEFDHNSETIETWCPGCDTRLEITIHTRVTYTTNVLPPKELEREKKPTDDRGETDRPA